MNTASRHTDIETALSMYHGPAYMQPKKAIVIPLVPKNKANIQDVKLAAAIALIVTMCQCLILHYDRKSKNQKRKAERLLKLGNTLLPKVSGKLHDFDIMSVGKKIDTLNTRLGFETQPSWLVFISFSIAILGDAFPDLKSSRLRDEHRELETIMSSLQDLHDYLTKKEKTDAAVYDAKAAELYNLWAELF